MSVLVCSIPCPFELSHLSLSLFHFVLPENIKKHARMYLLHEVLWQLSKGA